MSFGKNLKFRVGVSVSFPHKPIFLPLLNSCPWVILVPVYVSPLVPKVDQRTYRKFLRSDPFLCYSKILLVILPNLLSPLFATIPYSVRISTTRYDTLTYRCLLPICDP